MQLSPLFYSTKTMISYNSISISEDSKTLSFEITSDTPSERLDSILLWVDSTYKNYANAYTVLDTETTSQTYSGTVSASEVGLQKFEGVVYLEAESASTGQLITGLALDDLQFKKALLDKSIELINSNINIYTGEGHDNDTQLLIYISTLIEALHEAVDNHYAGSAFDLSNALSKLCDLPCQNC